MGEGNESQKLPRGDRETIFATRHLDVSRGFLLKKGRPPPPRKDSASGLY